MKNFNHELHEKIEEQIKAEIARVLNIPIAQLPFHLKPREVAKLIGVTPATLAVWRCTGRSDLEYFKSGSNVNYLLLAVVKYIADNTVSQTGGAYK